MTQLIEEITIKITLNHCEGESTVFGGPNDLRAVSVQWAAVALADLLQSRVLKHEFDAHGFKASFENTGLYEVPEIGGGDN